jgi:hypothetical protein
MPPLPTKSPRATVRRSGHPVRFPSPVTKSSRTPARVTPREAPNTGEDSGRGHAHRHRRAKSFTGTGAQRGGSFLGRGSDQSVGYYDPYLLPNSPKNLLHATFTDR